MGIIRTGTPAANAGEAEAVRRGWTGWRGSLSSGLSRAGEDRGREAGQGFAGLHGCIIDSLTYGVGTVTFRNLCGGRRQYGLRPIWPDREREREYASFYGELQASIEAEGVKVPVLIWKINRKFYVRYGASRLYIARKLDLPSIPAIVCNFDDAREPDGGYLWYQLHTPMDVLAALGNVDQVGVFEVSHERIDLHNVVPR
jgi:hypothetical protein